MDEWISLLRWMFLAAFLIKQRRVHTCFNCAQAQSCFYCVNQLSPFAVYLVNLLRLTFKTPKKSSLLSPPLCSSNVRVCFQFSTRCAQSVQSETHFWNLRFPYFSDSCIFQSRVFHPCIFATPAFSSPAFSAPPSRWGFHAKISYRAKLCTISGKNLGSGPLNFGAIGIRTWVIALSHKETANILKSLTHQEMR